MPAVMYGPASFSQCVQIGRCPRLETWYWLDTGSTGGTAAARVSRSAQMRASSRGSTRSAADTLV